MGDVCHNSMCGGRGTCGDRRGDDDVVRPSHCVTYATPQNSPVWELYAYPEFNRLLNYYKIRGKKSFLFEIYLKYWHSMGTSVSFLSIRAASSPIELQHNSRGTNLRRCSQPLTEIITKAAYLFDSPVRWDIAEISQPGVRTTTSKW